MGKKLGNLEWKLGGHPKTFSACDVGCIHRYAESCIGIIFITESGTVGTVVPPVSPVTPVTTVRPVETQNFASLHVPTNMPPPISSKTPCKNCFVPQSRNLASIVRGFKIGVTNWFRQHQNYNTIWQARFHDHIIRNDASYQRIREYTGVLKIAFSSLDFDF